MDLTSILDGIQALIGIDVATADTIGHIGYLSLAIGMALLAYKQIAGWVMRAIGEFLWLIVGFGIGMSSIWTWGLLFMGMELFGYRKWRRMQQASTCSECGRPKDADLRV